MHDFYPVCPSYTLLNDRGVYCGVPENISVCERCVANNKVDFLHRGVGVESWRAFWHNLFSYSNEVICFSESTKDILLKAYSDIGDKILIVPHQTNTGLLRTPTLDFSKRMHIGIVGGINYQKGLKIVIDIAEFIRKNNLDIRVTVIGVVDAVTPLPGLTVTGAYKHSELPEIFEKEDINIALFPSIWPETFSYVTSELMELNIPLACFNLGAPAERVSQYSRGLILESMEAIDIVNELSLFFDKFKRDASIPILTVLNDI